MTAAIVHIFENLVLCRLGKLFCFTLALSNISLLYKISLKSIRHVYHAFKEFCTVAISYEVFENTDDTYYRSCNNSDMYGDLENNYKSLYVFKMLRGFMKQYKI